MLGAKDGGVVKVHKRGGAGEDGKDDDSGGSGRGKGRAGEGGRGVRATDKDDADDVSAGSGGDAKSDGGRSSNPGVNGYGKSSDALTMSAGGTGGGKQLAVTTTGGGGEGGASGGDCRREKSLGLLSQKFVQLFLVSRARVVSLESAARTLLGSCVDQAKLKTKVRRLYDIANILSSLRLIEKTHLADSRKPAFRWLGVEKELAAAAAVNATALATSAATLELQPHGGPGATTVAAGSKAMGGVAPATAAAPTMAPALPAFNPQWFMPNSTGRAITPQPASILSANHQRELAGIAAAAGGADGYNGGGGIGRPGSSLGKSKRSSGNGQDGGVGGGGEGMEMDVHRGGGVGEVGGGVGGGYGDMKRPRSALGHSGNAGRTIDAPTPMHAGLAGTPSLDLFSALTGGGDRGLSAPPRSSSAACVGGGYGGGLSQPIPQRPTPTTLWGAGGGALAAGVGAPQPPASAPPTMHGAGAAAQQNYASIAAAMAAAGITSSAAGMGAGTGMHGVPSSGAAPAGSSQDPMSLSQSGAAMAALMQMGPQGMEYLQQMASAQHQQQHQHQYPAAATASHWSAAAADASHWPTAASSALHSEYKTAVAGAAAGQTQAQAQAQAQALALAQAQAQTQAQVDHDKP